MPLQGEDSGGGGEGVAAATVVVGGLLSAMASTVQHFQLCWPDFQCEIDPNMYPHLIVFNLLCVAQCNYVFLVSIVVCLYLLVS